MADYLYCDSDNLLQVTGVSDGLTGDYINDATVTAVLFETLVRRLSGAASDAGGGTVNLPITAHGLLDSDYIRLEGTQNYDEEYAVSSIPDTNHVIITATFAAETFTGKEEVYYAIRRTTGTWPEALAHEEGDDDGYYDGILPDDTIGILFGTFCYIYVTIISGVSKLTLRKKWRALYAPVE